LNIALAWLQWTEGSKCKSRAFGWLLILSTGTREGHFWLYHSACYRYLPQCWSRKFTLFKMLSMIPEQWIELIFLSPRRPQLLSDDNQLIASTEDLLSFEFALVCKTNLQFSKTNTSEYKLNPSRVTLTSRPLFISLPLCRIFHLLLWKKKYQITNCKFQPVNRGWYHSNQHYHEIREWNLFIIIA
jgi:hypothetical protein